MMTRRRISVGGIGGSKVAKIVIVHVFLDFPGFYSGYYIYAERSGAALNSVARLTTTVETFSERTGPFQLRFWYHMLGTGTGQLDVLVQTTAGIETTAFSRRGQREKHVL